MLSVLALALSFNAPDSKLLALRGGGKANHLKYHLPGARTQLSFNPATRTLGIVFPARSQLLSILHHPIALAGASTEQLSTVMSGLSVVTGVIAYAAPKTNLAGYGVAEADVTKDAKGRLT